MHQARRNSGTILAFTAAISLLLASIGIGIFFLIRTFGGEAELQAATDAGVLNVAKRAVSDQSVQLADGIEQNNFGNLVNDSGRITLINYNRAVAQTLLVGLNAQAQGTAQAASNAQTLKNALQNDTNNLSARLSSALTATDNPLFNFITMAFGNTGSRNSVRLLDLQDNGINFQSSRYQVAFSDAGDATNVFLDPSIVPPSAAVPANALSSRTANGGFRFLAGYTDVSVPNVFSVAGAVVNPLRQPHLISDRNFDASLSPAVSAGIVPPNSFRCAASRLAIKSDSIAGSAGCAEVGTLSSVFEASIPGGFITVSYSGNNGNAGTIPNLLAQISATARSEVIPQLKQRLREIKPRATDPELDALLNSNNVQPGVTTYIYLSGDQLVFSTAAPPRLVSNTAPDGNTTPYDNASSSSSSSSSSSVSGYITTTTTVTTTVNNDISASFTPSSGFNNLLAVLALDSSQSTSSSSQVSSVDENYVPPPPPPTDQPPPADQPPADQPLDPGNPYNPWDFAYFTSFGSDGGPSGCSGTGASNCSGGPGGDE